MPDSRAPCETLPPTRAEPPAGFEPVWTESVTVARGQRLEVVNILGTVTLEGWDGETVEVQADHQARDRVTAVRSGAVWRVGPHIEGTGPGDVVFDPPEQTASAETIRKGYSTYQDVCLGCHGLNAVSGLLIPDLRGSAYLHDQAAFDSVVLDGALRANGMAAFGEQLDAADGPAGADEHVVVAALVLLTPVAHDLLVEGPGALDIGGSEVVPDESSTHRALPEFVPRLGVPWPDVGS